jgi:hypothetical protein
MAKTKKANNKLEERCKVLEKVVISISNIYWAKETTDDQKKLIETIIGAAIWYLPHNENYWTGKISKTAKEALDNNKKAKLTKEHQFPRKIAAKELLQEKEKIANKETSLQKLYEEKYAKFNYVTPNENKKISRYQRDDVFIDIETAYQKSEIELIEITFEELKNLRKGTK